MSRGPMQRRLFPETRRIILHEDYEDPTRDYRLACTVGLMWRAHYTLVCVKEKDWEIVYEIEKQNRINQKYGMHLIPMVIVKTEAAARNMADKLHYIETGSDSRKEVHCQPAKNVNHYSLKGA